MEISSRFTPSDKIIVFKKHQYRHSHIDHLALLSPAGTARIAIEDVIHYLVPCLDEVGCPAGDEVEQFSMYIKA